MSGHPVLDSTYPDKIMESILALPGVLISNDKRKSLHEKLTYMRAAGSKNIQVVSDFDQTMTMYSVNGVKVPVCHAVFSTHPEFPSECKNKLSEVVQQHVPIAKDNTIEPSVKCLYMKEYWEASHDVIVQSGLHRSRLEKIVSESNLILRAKVDEFIKLLHQHNIPLLIFSGGVGNIIELVLDQLQLCTPNIRVLSNFMDFNHEDIVVGFQAPVIHSMNKTMETLQNCDYYSEVVSHRHCALVLGDHVNDGLVLRERPENHPTSDRWDCILRIGFLNKSTESNLATFTTAFDIVLLNDQAFIVPLLILQALLAP